MVLATKERIIAERSISTERYILSTMPVLYLPLYRLDSGDSGGSFISADGAGYTGTVTGALLSQGGRLFDGDDLITHTSADWQGNDSAGTILVWFKTNTDANQTLFASADIATIDYYLQFRVAPTTGKLEFTQKNDDVADVVTASTNVRDGTWHLGAVKSSGTTWSISVDGVDEGALAVAAGANTGEWFADTPNRDNFTIGAFVYTSTILYLTGSIGEVLVYDRPLPPQEVQNIFIATEWRYR